MQPTAQAVGHENKLSISPGGAKERVADGRTHDLNILKEEV